MDQQKAARAVGRHAIDGRAPDDALERLAGNAALCLMLGIARITGPGRCDRRARCRRRCRCGGGRWCRRRSGRWCRAGSGAWRRAGRAAATTTAASGQQHGQAQSQHLAAGLLAVAHVFVSSIRISDQAAARRGADLGGRRLASARHESQTAQLPITFGSRPAAEPRCLRWRWWQFGRLDLRAHARAARFHTSAGADAQRHGCAR